MAIRLRSRRATRLRSRQANWTPLTAHNSTSLTTGLFRPTACRVDKRSAAHPPESGNALRNVMNRHGAPANRQASPGWVPNDARVVGSGGAVRWMRSAVRYAHGGLIHPTVLPIKPRMLDGILGCLSPVGRNNPAGRAQRSPGFPAGGPQRPWPRRAGNASRSTPLTASRLDAAHDRPFGSAHGTPVRPGSRQAYSGLRLPR